MISKMSVQFCPEPICYDIHIGEGLLQSDLLFDELRAIGGRPALICDTVTEILYGTKLLRALLEQGFNAQLFSVTATEAAKTRKTKEWLEDELLANRYGRDSCLIALGGGVVTDLTGFVASTYCRGVPYVMLPTTLLAMVDASIGGKTGVTVPAGKNMIGAIYQPQAILMDTATLQTLPDCELLNGMVESIKHGLILDSEYFAFLEANVSKVLERDTATLEQVIEGSCRIKKEVVQSDVRELGKRRLLNFGHTIGHAIETLTHHAVSHGRAVAIGILAESYLSQQLGLLSERSFQRIVQLFTAYGIDTRLNLDSAVELASSTAESRLKGTFCPEAFLEVMKSDKKALANTPRFVLIQDIGQCLDCDESYCQSVPADILYKTLTWVCDAMRSY